MPWFQIPPTIRVPVLRKNSPYRTLPAQTLPTKRAATDQSSPATPPERPTAWNSFLLREPYRSLSHTTKKKSLLSVASITAAATPACTIASGRVFYLSSIYPTHPPIPRTIQPCASAYPSDRQGDTTLPAGPQPHVSLFFYTSQP